MKFTSEEKASWRRGTAVMHGWDLIHWGFTFPGTNDAKIFMWPKTPSGGGLVREIPGYFREIPRLVKYDNLASFGEVLCETNGVTWPHVSLRKGCFLSTGKQQLDAM